MHRVGPYIILGELGRGATSVVYRASRGEASPDIALKTIDLETIDPSNQEMFRERLRREVSILESLSHPSVVRIFDVGVDGSLVYIAMELIPGPSLYQVLRRGPLSPRESVIRFLTELSEAIDYLHSLKIIHRDIKPSNILFRENGSPVISDFGIAKPPNNNVDTGNLSQLGSLNYMTPEALTPNHYVPSPQTDQWAFAVVTYEVLSGQLAFHGESVEQILRKIVQDSPAPLRSLNPTIPAAVDHAIQKALAKDRSLRFDSCRAFAAAITKPLNDSRRWKPGAGIGPPSSAAGPLTMLESSPVPSGFAIEAVQNSDTSAVGDRLAAYGEIKESLSFYRDGLRTEYDSLSRQANVTYWLWVLSIIAGMGILGFGIILMFLGRVTEGVATAASSALVYFIQQVFQQREDFYRKEANRKNANLEYGNHWLMVVQSIETIPEDDVRRRRQARLVDILTEKLKNVPS